jgi:rubrerythrin
MKVIKKDNYRLIVYPVGRDGAYYSEEALIQSIEKQIKRHVDGISQVVVKHDEEYQCEYCHRFWEEDDDGCPICCNRAVDEWEEMERNP